MSVLINRMKMPKDCIKCPLCLFTDGHWKCLADGSHADFGGTCRPPKCPLIELPDHGDLIDRETLKKSLIDKGETIGIDGFSIDGLSADDVCCAIENAPVIIPAERSEE